MPKHRTYTDGQREEAIAAVYTLGSIASASRQSHIPYGTLWQWVTELPDEQTRKIREAIRAELVDGAWTAARDHIAKALEMGQQGGIGIKDRIEMAERCTRILKNIGEVAARYEIEGHVSHQHTTPLEERIDQYAARIEQQLEQRRQSLRAASSDN